MMDLYSNWKDGREILYTHFRLVCCTLGIQLQLPGYVLLPLQVLTNLREQKAPQKFTDNFPIEVGITHLLPGSVRYHLHLAIYFSLKAELIRTLLEREPSKRPTAEHVLNCDPMKRLRKKLKKSQACIPVL